MGRSVWPRADVAGLDLFIGEPVHLGQGISAATIDGFVTTVLLTWPGIAAAAANPLVSNVVSVRAFARAGFTPMRERRRTPPGKVTLIARWRWLREAANAGAARIASPLNIARRRHATFEVNPVNPSLPRD